MVLRAVPLALTLALLALPTTAAEMTAADQARWQELVDAWYPGRSPTPAGDVLRLEAPERAADAAIVPIAMHLKPDPADPVTRLALFVDDNPAPKVFTAELGVAAVPDTLKTRIRVDEYTWLHAVAETASGRLLQAATFVKASGGCSAPALKDPEQAMARLGRMKLNLPAEIVPGQPAEAQLLISHPNSSGLQFDQITRTYIQPHYVQDIAIRHNGRPVLTLETDISLSEDPSLHFSFVPDADGTLEVEVKDTEGGVYTRSWPVGGAPS